MTSEVSSKILLRAICSKLFVGIKLIIICVIYMYILNNINVYLYAESYDSKDPKETATDDQLVLDDTDSDGSQSDTSTDSSDDDI